MSGCASEASCQPRPCARDSRGEPPWAKSWEIGRAAPPTIVRGNQGVPSAKQLAAFEKESNIKQESSVNERRRRPDVDEDVIL